MIVIRAIIGPGMNFTHNVSINEEGGVALTALSLLIFFLICILLIISSRGDGQYFSLDYPFNLVALFMGQFVILLTTLTVPVHSTLYCIYRVSLLTVVGIVVTIVGNIKFFVLPKHGDLKLPFGYRHPKISFIIWVITIPLVLLELLESGGALCSQLDTKIAVAKLVGLTQKIIQAGIYRFSLRHKVAATGMSKGASWYWKLLSLFNFAMWLDSIRTENEATSFILTQFGNGLSIVTSVLDALLIDYRLLCCFLFAEHAFEVGLRCEQSSEKPARGTVFRNNDENITFHAQVSKMSGYAYVFGLILFASQIVTGLQYARLVPLWTHMFSIIADVCVLGFGIAFLRQLRYVPRAPQETSARAVEMMVSLMGAIALVHWVLQSAFASMWATWSDPIILDHLQYLIWTALKNAFRSCGILFQLYLFGKAGPFIESSHALRDSIRNHFIVPALMLSLLSVFTASIVDGYSGFMEMLMDQAKLSIPLMLLVKAGPLIHLGFALHMFLHFYIINHSMKRHRCPNLSDFAEHTPRSSRSASPVMQGNLQQPLLDDSGRIEV